MKEFNLILMFCLFSVISLKASNQEIIEVAKVESTSTINISGLTLGLMALKQETIKLS